MKSTPLIYWIVVALLIGALGSSSLVLAQTRQPLLQLAGESADNQAEFTTRNSNFEAVLTLLEQNGRSVSDLRISANPLQGEKEIPLQVNVLNTRRGPPYSVRASGSLQVQISAKLDAAGLYTGGVTLSYAGRRDVITVVVRREAIVVNAPSAPVQLELYSPIAINGVITVETSKADAVIPLFLSEVNGKNIGPLQATLSPLVGPDGDTVQPILKPANETFERDTAQINLTGVFSKAGSYTGSLRFQYGNSRDSYKLIVLQNVPKIEMRMIGAQSGVQRMRLLLNEVNGQPTTVEGVDLLSLIRDDGGAPIAQSFDSFRVVGEDVKFPLALDKGEFKSINVAISGNMPAGRYEATLQARTSEGKAAQAAVLMAVKHGLFFAAVMIGLGIIITGAVQALLNRRKRLDDITTLEYWLAQIKKELKETHPPATSRALDAAAAELQRAIDKLVYGLPTEIESVVEQAKKALAMVDEQGVRAGKKSWEKKSAEASSKIRQLRILRRLMNLTIFVVIAVIVTLVGVQLLWASNPIWGTTTDYIAALLWGLGLTQLSDAQRKAGANALANLLQGN